MKPFLSLINKQTGFEGKIKIIQGKNKDQHNGIGQINKQNKKSPKQAQESDTHLLTLRKPYYVGR